MKRTLKSLVLFLFIITTVTVFTAISASASPSKVVYISADGAGDGSSPDSPLGNTSGYKPGNKMEIYNAFYLGLNELKDTGGTLVIVGDVYLDSVESRFSSINDQPKAPSEFRTPKFAQNVSLTVTSVYNGVDYRKNGAELILDYATCNTTAFAFGCNTTIKNIDILFKYHSDHLNSWNTPFMLCGGGYDFTVDTGVKVTSLDVKTNTNGDQYPILVGGHRYLNINQNYTFTVKSGTWQEVIGGSYGITGTTTWANVNGNVTLNINGGTIGMITGTGSLRGPSNTINGNLSIIITGGDIGEVYASHRLNFTGNTITVSVDRNATVGKVFYAPSNYEGNPDTLIGKVTINNQSSAQTVPLVIQAPETQPPATQPPATQPPATQPPATQPTETQPAESETEILTPETVTDPSAPETQNKNNPVLDKNTVDNLTTILIIFVIIAAVIIIASFILNAIKMKFIK